MQIDRLYIVAYNIRQGGGVILLLEIINALKFIENTNITILVSCEMDIPIFLPKNIKVKSIKKNLLSRFIAEIYLWKIGRRDDTFLFFGNFPPLFKLSGRVFVYMQNRLLVEDLRSSLMKIEPLRKIRIFLQKKMLVTNASNADIFIVQTPSTKKVLLKVLKNRIPIKILPFCRSIEGNNEVVKRKKTSEDVFEFIYVASGEAHKNHYKLLHAWKVLADEGIYPILHLTLNENKDLALLSKFNQIKHSNNILFENHSNCSHDDILTLYEKVDALIYPSFVESLGLPLIEARHFGVPVIASELDYVRDVIDPEVTFDPQSEMSIARAVKRFMSFKSDKIVMNSAANILDYLINTDIEK